MIVFHKISCLYIVKQGYYIENAYKSQIITLNKKKNKNK